MGPRQGLLELLPEPRGTAGVVPKPYPASCRPRPFPSRSWLIDCPANTAIVPTRCVRSGRTCQGRIGNGVAMPGLRSYPDVRGAGRHSVPPLPANFREASGGQVRISLAGATCRRLKSAYRFIIPTTRTAVRSEYKNIRASEHRSQVEWRPHVEQAVRDLRGRDTPGRVPHHRCPPSGLSRMSVASVAREVGTTNGPRPERGPTKNRWTRTEGRSC